MYLELKTDILKLYGKNAPKKTYSLRGVNGLTPDDISNLLSYCTLYERTGEISDGWKEKVTSQKMKDVLIKYKMW